MSTNGTCQQCGQIFAQNDMIQYQSSWVCAGCKPVFMQKLKEGVSVAGDMEYAGFWIRFGAKFVDNLILGVINGIMQAAIVAVIAPSNPIAAFGILFILQMGLFIGYHTYFIGKHGAPPGKMACGLKVVTPEGEPVTYGRACGRYFAELLSSLTLTIGYIMAAFDEEKRSLHDRLCNTRVIKVRS